ncbi:MAG: DUF4738 domain-containing protein [Prevotella sp.]|nr:DUF4738 domain-containing protein [Prevotella sp.]
MKTPAIVILAAFALVFGGCQEKKPSEDKIIATRYVPERPQAPIAMPADSQVDSTQWQGSTYYVKVLRTPIDSVMVTADNGQKYIDNRCRLIITRQDGSKFIEKTFTKNTFLSYVNEPFRSGGILAGLRFEEVANANLVLSAVIGMPDAVDDLFVPLKVKIDGQGGLGISVDDDMGLLDYEERNDEEMQ